MPNVDSVLVGFERREPPGTEAERRATFVLVDAAFQHRRKMLRQALSGVLGGSAAAATEVLERAGVDPQARGEQLRVGDFLEITRALAERPGRAASVPLA
jgi:16S rRNA (adenine1518-N6/adenine1519-N6)-dimethyltransferase